MGKPVKSAAKSFVAIINRAEEIETRKSSVDLGEAVLFNGLVQWGARDLLPEVYHYLSTHSTTLQAVIEGTVDMVCENIENRTRFIRENGAGSNMVDVIRRMVNDYMSCGGIFLEVIPDYTGSVAEVSNLDFVKCRVDEAVDNVFFIEKERGRKKTMIRFPIHTPGERAVSVKFYRGEKARGFYPVPPWSAAIPSAETQIEIQNFHLNAIRNNFAVGGVLTFNGFAPPEEERKRIVKEAERKFSGSNAASTIMMAFIDGQSGSSVDFKRITDDQLDKKFAQLSEYTREQIFIAMRAIPVIFGQVVSTGFNSQEYDEAMAVYRGTVVASIRGIIERVLGDVFGAGMVRLLDKQTQQNGTI